MLAKESGSSEFDLPEEVLELLPSDPLEQLDVARKITSVAISTRVSALESESSVLTEKLAEKDQIIADLQSRVESLDTSLSETADKLALADQGKEGLVKERAVLSNTVRKLNRDVSKLEVFRKTLMRSLAEDEENPTRSLPVGAVSGFADYLGGRGRGGSRTRTSVMLRPCALTLASRISHRTTFTSSFTLLDVQTNDNDLLGQVQVLATRGHLQEALALFYSLHSPPPHCPQTYATLFHACARHRRLQDGLSLHRYMIAHNPIHPPDLFVTNHLINMYAKFGHLDYAHQLFDGMPKRNLVSWTALISEGNVTFSALPPSRSSSVQSTFSEAGSRFHEDRDTDAHSVLLASQTSTPRLTPPGSPPIYSASTSPTRTSKPVSPKPHSMSFATSRGMFDNRSSAPSSHHSSEHGRTRVDGKEFFRQVRSRVSYEQFGAFMTNVKELNGNKQTNEETLQKADEIFGPDNKDLHAIFEGLISRNVH